MRSKYLSRIEASPLKHFRAVRKREASETCGCALPDSFDLTQLQDRAAALVEAAKRAGADACDAVVAASRATGVEVRDGAIEESEGAENNSFSLRALQAVWPTTLVANRFSSQRSSPV